MQLFDTLGASLSPEMIAVRGDFERMRSAPTREFAVQGIAAGSKPVFQRPHFKNPVCT
jgi:hypothetical protein